ncbi:MAG: branched-chain amino acid aminotransferase [Oscillospiraceae bacterium]|jgi:branched-chain amino acid aminotransferase|nr:branched-chain amino acid aminotransferase [Oscillospiraceae bacterium]
MNIKITKTTNPKPIPADDSTLGFGRVFSDHMFVMNYKKGEGWYDPRIVPFDDIALSPAAMVLHYSQTIFEGLKAYRKPDGNIQLFRPEENFKRMNLSGSRMVIPEIPEDVALAGLKELLKLDKDWIPHSDGASLYIRPFVFASDPFVGVRPGEEYIFMIITSPSGPYYATGLNPVGIYVEESFVRAVRGGPGYTKTGGNYAASLAGQVEAQKQGLAQVLWLDGIERKYIEEVGAMNIFFVIGDEVITPELQGSILEGITRKSVIELCRKWGLKVTERKISIDEIADTYKSGALKECFGTGTAAVISPVGLLKWGDLSMEINNNKIGDVSKRLYDTLTGIQYGKITDDMNWVREL